MSGDPARIHLKVAKPGGPWRLVRDMQGKVVFYNSIRQAANAAELFIYGKHDCRIVAVMPLEEPPPIGWASPVDDPGDEAEGSITTS